MPTVLLRTESTDIETSAGCDYGMVQVTPELAAEALERIELVRRLAAVNDVAHLEFLSGAVHYAEASAFRAALPNGDSVIERCDAEGHVVIDRVIDVPFAKRTEMDLMCVDSGRVWWCCYPKHDSCLITTSSLEAAWLEPIAGRCLEDWEVNQEFVVSTGHITKTTADGLAGLCRSGELCLYEHGEYGWRIYVGESADTPASLADYRDLARLIARAQRLSCCWLRLDRDGPVYQGIPAYDW